jgi:hypothetical protein
MNYSLYKFSENTFKKEMYGFMIITKATHLITMPISLDYIILGKYCLPIQ